MNKVPEVFMDSIKDKVEEAYNTTVAAVLPHSDEMMALAGEGVFAVRYPDHPITRQLGAVAKELMS